MKRCPVSSSRLALPFALASLLVTVLPSPSRAQGTWILGECDDALGGRRTRAVHFSIPSRVAGDPLRAGERLQARDPGIPLVTDPASHAGGIAIDRINDRMYVTDGDPAGGLILKVIPLRREAGGRPEKGTTVTITGSYPFLDRRPGFVLAPVTGLAIEVRNNPQTGRDEPYKMWCTGGVDDPSMGYSLGEYHFFWLTGCPPPGERQFAWSTTRAVRVIPTLNNARDIAFGIVERLDEFGRGPEPCLFAIISNPTGQVSSFVDVWNVETGDYLYTNDGSGMTSTMGIALDTSMPVDLGPDVRPPHPFGPPRRISGRVLVLGTREGLADPYIRDITSSELSPTIYTPRGLSRCRNNPYIAGMDFSAELVAHPLLGRASGQGATGAPADVLVDVGPDYGESTACTGDPLLPQDPVSPAQPLTRLGPSTGTSFTLEATSFSPGESSATSSPFLLISKNALSRWTDPTTRQTLIVTPNGPGVIALTGQWLDAEGRVIEPTRFTDALLRAPAGQVPFMPDVAPIPYHTYFGQWVFLRGQHPAFPGDFPAGVEYFTSRPFRLSVANPE